MSKLDVVKEIHGDPRKHFRRRKYFIKSVDYLWSMDLMDFVNLKEENEGFCYVLLILDTFSKYCWTRSLKTKSAKEVRNAIESIFIESGRSPKHIVCDQGLEFWNSSVKSLMKQYKVNLYSVFSNIKASHAERCIRTLKNKLFILLDNQGNRKWIGKIDEVVFNYNRTVHSKHKLMPIEVNEENEKEIFSKYFDNDKLDKNRFHKKIDFHVGDLVRISKLKGVFDKGYQASWSYEIFEVYKVNLTNPPTYLIKDYENKPIRGGFYGHELKKSKFPDIFLIDEILERKNGKVLVKYRGFDNSHNRWIPESDLL